jgi:hypothetical protein
MRMTLWPPDLSFVFGIVAFALASLAVQSWRELAVFLGLTAVVILPIKWLGVAVGLEAFAADAFVAEMTSSRWHFRMDFSAALLAAFVLAAIAMILWRHVRTKPDANGDKIAD